MLHDVRPQQAVFRVVPPQLLKELAEGDAQVLAHPVGRAVRLQAAALAAAARQPSRNQAHVSELAAAPVAAVIRRAADKRAAADAALQREIRQVSARAAHEPLGMAAAGGVVLHIARVGYALIQRREVGVRLVQRRRKHDPPVVGREHARHGYAHAQQARAVYLLPVYKALQLPGDGLRHLRELRAEGSIGDGAIGYLVQAQIRREEAQVMSGDAHADGYTRVGDYLHAGRPASARALRLAVIAHKPALDQLVEILIYCGQAQSQRLRDRLPCAEALRVIQMVIYAAARLAAPVRVRVVHVAAYLYFS